MATARPLSSTLLTIRDADRARTALHVVSGDRIASIERELRAALAGSEVATRAYVRDHRPPTTELLAAAHVQPSRVLADVIEHTAASAPFTPWVARYELGDAVAL